MINNDILTKLHRAFSSAGVLERDHLPPGARFRSTSNCAHSDEMHACCQTADFDFPEDDLDVASRAHMYAPPSIL